MTSKRFHFKISKQHEHINGEVIREVINKIFTQEYTPPTKVESLKEKMADIYIRITEEDSKKLSEIAKQHNTTMQDLVYTALEDLKYL